MRPKAFLKSKLESFLAQRGYALSRISPVPRVSSTIARLRPQSVGLELLRLGGESDGGYLVPDDLDGLSACFSPGVSDVADFELSLADGYGVRCHLADASVDGPPLEHSLIDFEKKFLGSTNSGATIRLADWVQDKAGAEDDDLLLQMDIEGAEYDVLIDTPIQTLQRFRIIVLELHGLQNLFIAPCLPYFDAIFTKLTHSHTVVHLHPNNCCGTVTRNGVTVPRVLELTLLRNDRFASSNSVTSFPHPLDRPNLPDRPDLHLPTDWYAA